MALPQKRTQLDLSASSIPSNSQTLEISSEVVEPESKRRRSGSPTNDLEFPSKNDNGNHETKEYLIKESISSVFDEKDEESFIINPPPINPSGSLYTHGTQYRCWRFSGTQIEKFRMKANNKAIQQSMKLLANQDSEIWTHADFLTPKEEYDLVQHFMEQTTLVSRKFKLNELVRATALICMRRFFLKKSVLDYDPKTVMLTCLFLASKIENCVMKLDALVHGVKALDKMELKELEFVIAETLNFQFWIRHPFEASFGIFLDCQETLESLNMNILSETWKLADGFICTSLFTDCGLRFMPSQVAMACWLWASQRTSFPFESMYLPKKKERCPEAFQLYTDSFLSLLHTIIDVIKGFVPTQKPEIVEIMKKLERIRGAKAQVLLARQETHSNNDHHDEQERIHHELKVRSIQELKEEKKKEEKMEEDGF